MAKTLIRNPSPAPLSLPLPFRGILPAGGGVCVDATLAQVRAALGGSEFLGGVELTEVASSPASAFYLGNLLDPLATQAQSAAADAAQLLLLKPGRQSTALLDGSAPASLILLAAGHAAGLYRVHRALMKAAAATAGTAVLTHGWTDPDGGAVTRATGALALTGTGPVDLDTSDDVIRSTGAANITLAIAFTGVTGTPSIRMDGAVTPVG